MTKKTNSTEEINIEANIPFVVFIKLCICVDIPSLNMHTHGYGTILKIGEKNDRNTKTTSFVLENFR